MDIKALEEKIAGYTRKEEIGKYPNINDKCLIALTFDVDRIKKDKELYFHPYMKAFRIIKGGEINREEAECVGTWLGLRWEYSSFREVQKKGTKKDKESYLLLAKEFFGRVFKAYGTTLEITKTFVKLQSNTGKISVGYNRLVEIPLFLMTQMPPHTGLFFGALLMDFLVAGYSRAELGVPVYKVIKGIHSRPEKVWTYLIKSALEKGVTPTEAHIWGHLNFKYWDKIFHIFSQEVDMEDFSRILSVLERVVPKTKSIEAEDLMYDLQVIFAVRAIIEEDIPERILKKAVQILSRKNFSKIKRTLSRIYHTKAHFTYDGNFGRLEQTLKRIKTNGKNISISDLAKIAVLVGGRNYLYRTLKKDFTGIEIFYRRKLHSNHISTFTVATIPFYSPEVAVKLKNEIRQKNKKKETKFTKLIL